jgi:hypothetical protein
LIEVWARDGAALDGRRRADGLADLLGELARGPTAHDPVLGKQWLLALERIRYRARRSSVRRRLSRRRWRCWRCWCRRTRRLGLARGLWAHDGVRRAYLDRRRAANLLRRATGVSDGGARGTLIGLDGAHKSVALGLATHTVSLRILDR